METVALRFQYTQSEYVRAERQYLIANKTVHKYDVILIPIFLLFSIGYLFFSSFSMLSIFLLGLVLVVTAFGSYIYLLMPILKFKLTTKYHEEYTLIFSKEIICFGTPSIESKLKWCVYSELWENDDFYFLIQAPRIYTLIPKRAFKDQNEIQLFTVIAHSNLKAIKHMK